MGGSRILFDAAVNCGDRKEWVEFTLEGHGIAFTMPTKYWRHIKDVVAKTIARIGDSYRDRALRYERGDDAMAKSSAIGALAESRREGFAGKRLLTGGFWNAFQGAWADPEPARMPLAAQKGREADKSLKGQEPSRQRTKAYVSGRKSDST